jgi:hypothetical protein
MPVCIAHRIFRPLSKRIIYDLKGKEQWVRFTCENVAELAAPGSAERPAFLEIPPGFPMPFWTQHA